MTFQTETEKALFLVLANISQSDAMRALLIANNSYTFPFKQEDTVTINVHMSDLPKGYQVLKERDYNQYMVGTVKSFDIYTEMVEVEVQLFNQEPNELDSDEPFTVITVNVKAGSLDKRLGNREVSNFVREIKL